MDIACSLILCMITPSMHMQRLYCPFHILSFFKDHLDNSSALELSARWHTVSERLGLWTEDGLLRCHFPNFRETKRKEGRRRRNATSAAAAALSSQTEIDPLAAAAAAAVEQLGNGSEGTQSQKRKIYGRRPTPQKVYLVISRALGLREVK